MKRILLVSLLICLYGSTACAQKESKPKAWEIYFRTRMEALPNAPQWAIKFVRRYNKGNSVEKSLVLVSDSLFRLIPRLQHTKTGRIINLRDSVFYKYIEFDSTFIRNSYETYLKKMKKKNDDNPFFSDNILNKRYYSDSTKTILGLPVEKLIYEVASTKASADTVQYKVWYAKDIPNWHFNKLRDLNITGFPLKIVTKGLFLSGGYTKIVKKAVSIKRVPLEESDYLPPEGFRIVEKGFEDKSN